MPLVMSNSFSFIRFKLENRQKSYIIKHNKQRKCKNTDALWITENLSDGKQYTPALSCTKYNVFK